MHFVDWLGPSLDLKGYSYQCFPIYFIRSYRKLFIKGGKMKSLSLWNKALLKRAFLSRILVLILTPRWYRGQRRAEGNKWLSGTLLFRAPSSNGAFTPALKSYCFKLTCLANASLPSIITVQSGEEALLKVITVTSYRSFFLSKRPLESPRVLPPWFVRWSLTLFRVV